MIWLCTISIKKSMNHIVLLLAAERRRQQDRKRAAQANGNNFSIRLFFFFKKKEDTQNNLFLFSFCSVTNNCLVWLKWIANILFIFHYLWVWSCKIYSAWIKHSCTENAVLFRDHSSPHVAQFWHLIWSLGNGIPLKKGTGKTVRNIPVSFSGASWDN